MNTIIPARHFCRVGDEIWFLTRNTYALYNYSFSSKKLEYKAFPCEIEIGPYPYSSVFCYGNRIVCVPAMAKSYLIYDVSNNHFEQIKTPNTERGISFDNVVQHNNLLYCFPVHCKNPVVIFDMNELCESGSIELQQNIVSDGDEYAPAMSILGIKVYGCILMSNLIYCLNMEDGSISFTEIDGIEPKIESLFKDEKYVYMYCKDESFIRIREDGTTKDEFVDIGTNERVEFIGKFNGSLFVDAPKSAKKMLIEDRDDKHYIRIFDESKYVRSKKEEWTYGTIVHDSDLSSAYCIDYYLSGCSNGLFHYENKELKYDGFCIDDQVKTDMQRHMMMKMKNGDISIESNGFGLSDYLNAIRQY